MITQYITFTYIKKQMITVPFILVKVKAIEPTYGGEGTSGNIRSESSKDKLRGENNVRFGVKHTDAALTSMKEYACNRTPEHTQKIKNNLKGITPWNKG